MTTTRREVVLSLGVVGASGLAGCSSVLGGDGGSSGESVPLDDVGVRIVDVRTPDAGLTTATIPILVGFENPASTTISGLTGDLDIYIRETRIGSEDVSISRLGPGEETIEELSIVVEYGELSGSIVDAIRSGSLDIRIDGALRAAGQVEQFSVSTSDEGR